MEYNTDITIYNNYVDSVTHSTVYQRSVIYKIAWENRKAANVLKSGLIAADSAAIYIPFTAGANYKSPKTWLALTTKTGYWTLQAGDFIVKGIVTDEITGSFTMTSLKAKYDDVVNIKSIDSMNIGSYSLRHWQVGAS